MLRRGFTLIELLIVVAIIGILASIAVVNLMTAQVRAKVAQTKADMRAVETAVESYQIDNGDYLSGSLPGHPPEMSLYNWRLRPLTSPINYISSLPMDPFNIGYPDEWSDERPGRTTYDYNTHEALIDIWTGGGSSPEDAEERWQEYYGRSAWKLVGIGPNGRFAVDDWGGVKYDPTNGVRSDGCIVLTQAIRFQD